MSSPSRDTVSWPTSGQPGQRSAEIPKATRIRTSDLALVLRELIADNKLEIDGVGRGTT